MSFLILRLPVKLLPHRNLQPFAKRLVVPKFSASRCKLCKIEPKIRITIDPRLCTRFLIHFMKGICIPAQVPKAKVLREEMPQRSCWAMFSIAPTHGNDVLSVFGVFQRSAITLCLIRDGHHLVGLANHRCGGLIVKLSILMPQVEATSVIFKSRATIFRVSGAGYPKSKHLVQYQQTLGIFTRLPILSPTTIILA